MASSALYIYLVVDFADFLVMPLLAFWWLL